MIKRPLNTRFRELVLADKKTTTIRDKAWPVGVPIMLYNWSGAPYRSKQIDVAPVIVKGFWTIRITHREDGGMLYAYGRVNDRPLHETEGFATRAELDAWFSPLVKPGQNPRKNPDAFQPVEPRISSHDAERHWLSGLVGRPAKPAKKRIRKIVRKDA